MMQVRLIGDRGKQEMSKCSPFCQIFSLRLQRVPKSCTLSSLASLRLGRGDTEALLPPTCR